MISVWGNMCGDLSRREFGVVSFDLFEVSLYKLGIHPWTLFRV